MSQKILLVDGHSIANRAFFGLPPMSYNGIPTGAILGFFNILFRTIDDEKPDQLAIAFDLNKPTFRHKMFEDYKGTRSPMLPELREQIPRIRKMLEEAGCAIVTKEGYEADDVLGTLAKKHGADGDSVVILSGDRDLLQLVDDQVTVRLPKTKKNGSEVEIYRPEDVQEAYGVTPDGFLQMKALMGDA
ncbi:MAG TPA: DNA polymerase I, partial [Lachnospiraceae bacterium]|nr:DNA polymerase I [Lachnospiraceae bacterium]